MRNDFKVGVNYIHEPILGGDFSTGTSGQYTLLSDSVRTRRSPTSPIFGGFFGDKTPVKQYSSTCRTTSRSTER